MVSVIPEVNFNEKFIAELSIDLGYSVLNIVKSYVTSRAKGEGSLDFWT